MKRENKVDDFNKVEQSDKENINYAVGNSRFFDDIWDFQGLESSNGTGRAKLQIKFSEISDDDIKLVIKKYAALCLLKKTVSSVRREISAYMKFQQYLVENYPGIHTLEKISPMIIRSYYYYILDSKSRGTGVKLSRTGIFHCAAVVKNILVEGSKRGWKVPDECTWIMSIYADMIEGSPRTKVSAKTSKQMFSDEVVKNIIQSSLQDSCSITQAAIIVQSQVGLRIGELLSLQEGCIKKIDGKIKIQCMVKKTKKGEVLRKKPANDLVAEVIKKLELATEELRRESGMPYLFIRRNEQYKTIIRCNHSNWTRDFMRPFVERWDIRENGNLINLSSHYFRHIFATYAHRKGMPIQSIMKMFDHESLNMTEVYTHITEDDVKARFLEIFSEGSIIAGVASEKIRQRLKEDTPFQGKTQKQVEAIIGAMKIHVTASGVCFHHPARRDPCVDDGDCLICPNFITTPEFLPVHKKRIMELDKEISRAEISGNEIWKEKNQKLRDHIFNKFIEPMELALEGQGDSRE